MIFFFGTYSDDDAFVKHWLVVHFNDWWHDTVVRKVGFQHGRHCAPISGMFSKKEKKWALRDFCPLVLKLLEDVKSRRITTAGYVGTKTGNSAAHIFDPTPSFR
jgi:hypothetical protein